MHDPKMNLEVGLLSAEASEPRDTGVAAEASSSARLQPSHDFHRRWELTLLGGVVFNVSLLALTMTPASALAIMTGSVATGIWAYVCQYGIYLLYAFFRWRKYMSRLPVSALHLNLRMSPLCAT